MATPPSITRETFLATLRASGLLTNDQFADVLGHLPDSPRGRVLARALVEMGLLTRFQAEQLLAGRSQGYFLGKYRILDELGKGGMGRVFKAIHQTMNRVVALKVLAPGYGSTPRAQKLFFREMRAIARLAHPNIVAAYDAGQLEGRAYLVMEYVDGPSLDQLVRRQGPLPVGQACAFVRQAALGLQYAYEMGMVHRDIKPGNLLLAREGSAGGRCAVKILDFGLARLHEPDPVDPAYDSILSRDSVVLGTPDYVSPEQARGLHLADIRSDLYSLGCTFYYLLTGEVPFPGGTVMEKLIRHTTEVPALVTELRRDVPRAVATVVERLLAKRPADRYQTPAELAAAVEPFAVELPAPAAPAPAGAPVLPDEDSAHDLSLPGGILDGDGPADAIGTIPPHFGPTQYSIDLRTRVTRRTTHGEEFRRRVVLAVVIAVGATAGIIGLLGWLWGR